MRLFPSAIGLLLFLPLLAVGCASYEIDGLAGYSSVQADAPNGVRPFFDEDAGFRLAANGSRSFFTPGFLRGEGGSGLRGNINVSGSRYTGGEGSELFVVSPQIGPSFRVAGFGLFAEAGATAGGAYAQLDVGGEDDDEISWAYRPYGRVGIVRDWFTLGVEGGYERTGLDFGLGAAGEDYENWYVGVVLGIRLTK